MRFTAFWAENWKSFGRRTEIPLDPCTLLIGPNNAGKSNILGIPIALARFMIDGPGNFVSERSIEEHVRSGADVARIGVRFVEEAAHGDYSVEVHRSGKWAEHFSCEGLSFSVDMGGRLRPNRRPTSAVPEDLGIGNQSVLGWALGNPNLEWVKPIAMLAKELRSYRVWRCDPATIDQPAQVARQAMLGPRGEAAAAVLDHLRDRFPGNYAALQADLRRCATEFDHVVSEAHEAPGYKEIFFHEKSGIVTRCQFASEGLKFLLYVLLIVHSPSPPNVLAFEEIEHGVHPSRIKEIVDFLRQLGSRDDGPQVLMTTHSPLVLDRFRDSPASVVVVERHGGTTTTSRLDERLKALGGNTGGAALGDLWYSGVLGGVPSP